MALVTAALCAPLLRTTPGALVVAADPAKLSLTGQAVSVADLAERYGVDVTR